MIGLAGLDCSRLLNCIGGYSRSLIFALKMVLTSVSFQINFSYVVLMTFNHLITFSSMFGSAVSKTKVIQRL